MQYPVRRGTGKIWLSSLFSSSFLPFITTRSKFKKKKFAQKKDFKCLTKQVIYIHSWKEWLCCVWFEHPPRLFFSSSLARAGCVLAVSIVTGWRRLPMLFTWTFSRFKVQVLITILTVFIGWQLMPNVCRLAFVIFPYWRMRRIQKTHKIVYDFEFVYGRSWKLPSLLMDSFDVFNRWNEWHAHTKI